MSFAFKQTKSSSIIIIIHISAEAKLNGTWKIFEYVLVSTVYNVFVSLGFNLFRSVRSHARQNIIIAFWMWFTCTLKDGHDGKLIRIMAKSVTLILFFVSAYNVMNCKWVPRFSWVFAVALNSTLNATSSPKIFQKDTCYSVRSPVPSSIPELYMKTFRFLCIASRKMVHRPTEFHTDYRILYVYMCEYAS